MKWWNTKKQWIINITLLEKYILHDTCYANKPGLVQESIDSRLGLIKKIVKIDLIKFR
jgi:hypothetical protein